MYKMLAPPPKIYAWPLLFHLSTTASLSHANKKLTIVLLAGVRRENGKPFMFSSSCEMLL